MAKIVEDVVIIKISRIQRDDSSNDDSIVTSEVRAALEQVAQELIGDNAIVEIVDN